MQAAELKCLFDQLWTTHADAIINFIAVLSGAFVGTMFAFLLQLKAQRNQATKESLMESHRIFFCLFHQVNTLALIQRDFINPHLNSRVRYIEIPATLSFDTKKNIYDLKTLDFMLETEESRKILYEIYLAQENYIETLRIFNTRSNIHRTEVQPALAKALGKADFKIENGVSIEQIKTALGVSVYESIFDTTESSIEALNRTSQLLMKSKVNFREYAVKRFKSNNFTEFEI